MRVARNLTDACGTDACGQRATAADGYFGFALRGRWRTPTRRCSHRGAAVTEAALRRRPRCAGTRRSPAGCTVGGTSVPTLCTWLWGRRLRSSRRQ